MFTILIVVTVLNLVVSAVHLIAGKNPPFNLFVAFLGIVAIILLMN